MARIKSSGDSGSPWRTPRACLNFFPGIPLSNTFEDEVASSVVIQSLCRGAANHSRVAEGTRLSPEGVYSGVS